MLRFNGNSASAPGKHSAAGDLDRTSLVLVVDDDEAIRLYIKTVLERAGLNVIEAVDGVAAYAAYQSLGGSIDLLVTDIRMPRMRGDDLASRIKFESPGMPVIFISGEPGSGKFHDPPNGFYFVEKPFCADDILEAARRMLLSHR